jgi:hypothetical protein
MVSRDRMESFAGLLFLCVIFLAQEIRMPKASFGEKAIRNPAKVSWMQSSSAKCTDGSSSRSALDEMDCAILPEQRLCRAPQVVASDAAHSKGSTATTATISSTPMAMPYQCAGPDYTTFGQALTDYRQNVAENGATWGRRLYGLPASQNILFFGNSHTQQIARTLACQHEDSNAAGGQIASLERLGDGPTAPTRVRLANNATLVIFTDRNVLLSDEWEFLFAQATGGMQIQDFDAMILGLFNDCDSKRRSDDEACASISDLMFREIASVFGGPMLFISMMAALRNEESIKVRDTIREYREQKRKNMWFIHGRRYVSKVGLEGAKDTNTDRWNVTDALNSGARARSSERCQGMYGGHADLLSWDATEFLYNQLLK